MNHEAFMGVTVDHLYRTCPGLIKAMTFRKGGSMLYGSKLFGTVDPLGTDVCGWCVRKWKGTQ